jgi:glycosyltransferase involved in cell wall biosynthesis
VKASALYLCYYDVGEPLVQTQVLTYLNELAQQGIEVHLLTFERSRLSSLRHRAIAEELAAKGISWHHLRYHSWPSLPATLFDIAAGTLASIAICKKHGIDIVHARSHVPAAMALGLKRLLGCRFLFDMRGLLAEEYVDSGNWNRRGLKFKLTGKMERAFFRAADAIVMLTDRIKEELTAGQPELRGRASDIEVIPCCVDTAKFAVSEADRASYRRERGWDGRTVLTYAGKLGGWYLTHEMVRFFTVARSLDSRFYFQVLTQSDPRDIKNALDKEGVGAEHYETRYLPPSQLPLALAASDAGISLIKPTHSKLASSPTKIGEYLAAGLPVVSSSEIGDCDRFLRGCRLGVILATGSLAAYQHAVSELKALIELNDTRDRCRSFAERELSLSQVGGPRYLKLYDRLIQGKVMLAGASSDTFA